MKPQDLKRPSLAASITASLGNHDKPTLKPIVAPADGTSRLDPTVSATHQHPALAPISLTDAQLVAETLCADAVDSLCAAMVHEVEQHLAANAHAFDDGTVESIDAGMPLDDIDVDLLHEAATRHITKQIADCSQHQVDRSNNPVDHAGFVSALPSESGSHLWPASHVIEALNQVYGQPTSGRWPCPAHQGTDANLSVREGDHGEALIHCFSHGCDVRDVLLSLGLKPGARQSSFKRPEPARRRSRMQLVPKPSSTKKPARNTNDPHDRQWDYFDDQGTNVYSVRRWDATPHFSKNIRPVLPNGRFGFPKDAKRVLYSAGEGLDDQHVILCEGEKCVDALTSAGHVAATWVGGAGQVEQSIADGAFDRLRRAATVSVWPDNDEPGRDAMRKVADHLQQIGVHLEVVFGADDANPKDDAADWLAANSIDSALPILSQDLTVWAAQTSEPRLQDVATVRDFKPKIQMNNRHDDEVADDIVAAIVKQNEADVRLVLLGNVVAEWRGDQLTPVDGRDGIHDIIERRIRPIRRTESGDKQNEQPHSVSSDLRKLVLRRLKDHLPFAIGLTTIPIIRKDGSVRCTAGYDEQTQLILARDVEVTVPDQPTQDQIDNSLALLLSDVLGDFPTPSPDDSVHILALLFTILTRHLYPLAPLFALTANAPGSGKGLIGKVLWLIITGKTLSADQLNGNDDETRKQITGLLSHGRGFVFFDESRFLSARSLSRLLTTSIWSDRLLGLNHQVELPNRLTLAAAGNNIELGGDMPRRTVLIRLESPDGHNRNSDWLHPNLLDWVEEHRLELLEAALILVRAWFVAECPRPTSAPLGSFEDWHKLVGGIVEHATGHQILANSDEWSHDAATDDVQWHQHLAELLKRFGDQPFPARNVIQLLELDELDTAPAGPTLSSDRGGADELGKRYRSVKDRWFGGLRIVRDGTTAGSARWKVEQTAAQSIL